MNCYGFTAYHVNLFCYMFTAYHVNLLCYMFTSYHVNLFRQAGRYVENKGKPQHLFPKNAFMSIHMAGVVVD